MKKKIPSTCTWGYLLDLLFTSYGYLQVSKWNIDIWSWNGINVHVTWTLVMTEKYVWFEFCAKIFFNDFHKQTTQS